MISIVTGRSGILTTIAVWMVGVMGVVAFATGTVTVDYLPSLGTYGVSAGSNVHYCSAEWYARGLATVLPVLSCESTS